MDSDEGEGEFIWLDLSKWEQVKQVRGPDAGKNPVIMGNGSVHVDKNRVGEEVRLFVRKVKKKK